MRDDSRRLAERIGTGRYDLECVDVQMLTPTMRRIKLHADDLTSFSHEAGQDLMLTIAADKRSIVRRRYTIRMFDQIAAVVAIDVVLHGDGPGARWAAAVAPGDRVEAIGPRGKVSVVDGAEWHLFVGDESFLPAAFAMAESADTPVPKLLVLEVGSTVDEPPAPEVPGLSLQFVHRGGVSAGRSTLLGDELRTITLPSGVGHAYVSGELQVVAGIRSVLLEHGLTPEQISPKPYWRADTPNANHGEPRATPESAETSGAIVDGSPRPTTSWMSYVRVLRDHRVGGGEHGLSEAGVVKSRSVRL